MSGISMGLRWAGWGFLGLGLLVTGSLIASMKMSGAYADAPGLIIPLLFVGAGAGLLRLAHLARKDPRFGLGHLARWVFLSVGGVMIVGGVIMSFGDLGALFLVFMGVVFTGAGWLAGPIAITAKDKERVFIEDTSGTTKVALEGARTVRSSAFVEVDVGATTEEKQAAVDAWRAERMALRPDWVSGRIRSNTSKNGWLWLMPVVIILVGVGLVGFGLAEAQIVVFVGVAGIALGLFLLFAFIMRRRRSGVFGATILALEQTPVAPSERLEGVLEIPVPRERFADASFTLTLTCTGMTRSEGASERTVYTADELWSEGKTVRASGEAALRVRVVFDLPGDLPDATLTPSAAAQTRWTLKAIAKGAALDFREYFDLPILALPGGGLAEHGDGERG